MSETIADFVLIVVLIGELLFVQCAIMDSLTSPAKWIHIFFFGFCQVLLLGIFVRVHGIQ
jgi:hypothetical protein